MDDGNWIVAFLKLNPGDVQKVLKRGAVWQYAPKYSAVLNNSLNWISPLSYKLNMCRCHSLDRSQTSCLRYHECEPSSFPWRELNSLPCMSQMYCYWQMFVCSPHHSTIVSWIWWTPCHQVKTSIDRPWFRNEANKPGHMFKDDHISHINLRKINTSRNWGTDVSSQIECALCD